MPLRARQATVVTAASYEGRLAGRILEGAADASQAAMRLLEHCNPQTLDGAVALLATQGTVTVDAFDRVADAWETYRHFKDLSWD